MQEGSSVVAPPQKTPQFLVIQKIEKDISGLQTNIFPSGWNNSRLLNERESLQMLHHSINKENVLESPSNSLLASAELLHLSLPITIIMQQEVGSGRLPTHAIMMTTYIPQHILHNTCIMDLQEREREREKSMAEQQTAPATVCLCWC